MINVHTINVLQKKTLKQLFDLSLLKPAKIGSLTSKNDMVLSCDVLLYNVAWQYQIKF